MMKKILMSAAVCLLAATATLAQNEDLKHEIGVSYGAGVTLIGDGIGNGIGSGLIDAMTGYEWDNDKQFGTLGIQYYYHLDNPRVAVGAIVTYARYGEDIVRKDDHSKAGDRNRQYFTLMPSIKYYWVNNNHFGLYSKAAVGPMLLTAKEDSDHSYSESKFYFMAQVSLLGLEFGSKLRGFAELGAGEQGILLAGLKYKF